MNLRQGNHQNLKTIFFIGNYLPRQCGIATFTSDLLKAVSNEAKESNCWAIAMNDIVQGYRYPKEVRFELNANQLDDYKLAAEFLNVSRVDLICLQHEFGIYGGPNGSHILRLIRNLRMPVVTTLHTLLPNPEPLQKDIIKKIGEISYKLVVMSHKSELLLKEVYGIPDNKIVLIHHGIPDLSFIDPNFFKDQFGVEGKKVILTFGLINPGKGIETMIEALPEVVKEHPDVVYIVLGATHPNVKRVQGEAYRHSLQRRARELNVGKNVIFFNRFVELEQLCEFLGAADIYVAPYLNKEQISSGTLAYALGAGKAVVSTPYWYAEEILDDGRGILVPFKDSDSMAKEIINLLNNDVNRHDMRKKSYMYSRQMVWKEVAKRYLEVFEEVKEYQLTGPISKRKKSSLSPTPFEMPVPKFNHLYRLTDDVGILQHAKYIIPNRKYGYCTDDNARALILVLLAQTLSLEDSPLLELDCRYLSFILHAFNEENGRFRKFMGYDRKWCEDKGSEDSHARAIWSLGIAIGSVKIKEFGETSLDIFEKAVEKIIKFTSPRAWALGLLGIHAYLVRFHGDSKMRRMREKIANSLFDHHRKNATDDWPWLEDEVAYDNGRIPQALLISGQWLHRNDMIEEGLRVLNWLLQIQTNSKNQLSPIGNKGWYPRGGEKANFDQQPLEAQCILEACIEAYKVTQDEKWALEARRCFEWFLGNNDRNLSLYDYSTGGCHDGITSTGLNKNQGAESTLAWLISLLRMYSLDHLLEIDLKERMLEE